MLDKLLGRAELKERIEELSEEKRHLQRRVEAEEQRRADAVADKQRAEERVNHLEDRIEQLEDRIERETSGQKAAPSFQTRTELSLERSAALYRRLDTINTDTEGALTAAVSDPDSIPESVSNQLGDRTALVRRAAPALVVIDEIGLVAAAIDLPIMPESFDSWADSFRLQRSWFRPTSRFAFALVRSDTFALGVYEADERVSLSAFESDVKSQHSKGGFSQDRFERRRDGQIADHLDQAREAIQTVTDVDRIILVGERTVLSELRDLADTTDVADASGDPEAALDRAFRDFWAIRVRGL